MDFKTHGDISLRDGDLRLSHTFDVTNQLPTGTDATNVDVTILSSDSTDYTAYILYGSASISNNIITLSLSYSDNVPEGRYMILFYVDFDNSQKLCRFNRLYLKALSD